MDITNQIIQLMLKFPAVLIALTFRPFAESLVAYLLGDTSQKNSGRLSISPAAHLDPIGFLLLFFVGFGWSKPVYINDRNFKNRRFALALYFLSGTIMNLLIAVFIAWLGRILDFLGFNFTELQIVFNYIIMINLGLGAFCLLPIPPLAGYYFLLQVLPYNLAIEFRKIERFSLIIIFLIMFTDFINYVVAPIHAFLYFIFSILT